MDNIRLSCPVCGNVIEVVDCSGGRTPSLKDVFALRGAGYHCLRCKELHDDTVFLELVEEQPDPHGAQFTNEELTDGSQTTVPPRGRPQ